MRLSVVSNSQRLTHCFGERRALAIFGGRYSALSPFQATSSLLWFFVRIASNTHHQREFDVVPTALANQSCAQISRFILPRRTLRREPHVRACSVNHGNEFTKSITTPPVNFGGGFLYLLQSIQVESLPALIYG